MALGVWSSMRRINRPFWVVGCSVPPWGGQDLGLPRAAMGGSGSCEANDLLEHFNVDVAVTEVLTVASSPSCQWISFTIAD
jgi:hypothetical protein